MQNIFDLELKELADIFTQTALKMGLGSASIIEKDYWVVKVLDLLYSNAEFSASHVFKGGTSLSKCYGLIQRFSEDIDITISRELLGFNEKIEDIKELGRKKQKRYFNDLQEKSEIHVKVIAEKLSEDMQKCLQNNSYQVYVSQTDKQKIIFEYPKALNLSMYPDDSYVQPKIILEFGCRGDIIPSHKISINTYVETTFENIFSANNVMVRSLNPERTFWEKITLLHMLAHQDDDKPLQLRIARHYYDVCMLSKTQIADIALDNIDLLNAVSQNKSVFFRSKQASYHTANPGTLKLIPNPLLLRKVESDYRDMKDMFFDNYILFSDIINDLKCLEEKLNE